MVFYTLCFAFSLSLQDGWCDASDDANDNRLIRLSYGTVLKKCIVRRGFIRLS
ncbi:hypothetical protein [Bartonella sp. ML70XJBT.G]|uniref:hypothetical protein n=1 Tax=Bartonella sp. ML70XJBT.G TaxID=3019093 RepID=UPI0023606F40|nr:hypothetical protein [Bartonella sp. ML70XJBT.G]